MARAGRQSCRLGVVPAEAALAHSRLISQDRQREIVVQMIVDPVVERAEFVLRGL
jgi:hypothetical protein